MDTIDDHSLNSNTFSINRDTRLVRKTKPRARWFIEWKDRRINDWNISGVYISAEDTAKVVHGMLEDRPEVRERALGWLRG